nr:nucleotidyl transferase AbiEii/AbiGii toxin family protein [Streptomyces olivoverticillatus]
MHRRLLADVIAVGTPYPLVLTGGYAVQAHGLVDRVSRDLDVATDTSAQLSDVASSLRAGLEARGWHIAQLELDALSARFMVTDPATCEDCEVDILKQTMSGAPLQTVYGPVLPVEDVIAAKMVALAERGVARDLIDAHAASARWSHTELEEYGQRHAWGGFDLADLRARLEGAEWMDDREFIDYGLDETQIAGLRRWAQEWADDIGERLAEEAPYEEPPSEEE